MIKPVSREVEEKPNVQPVKSPTVKDLINQFSKSSPNQVELPMIDK
jgi:hypothetical protein